MAHVSLHDVSIESAASVDTTGVNVLAGYSTNDTSKRAPGAYLGYASLAGLAVLGVLGLLGIQLMPAQA